MLLNTQRAMFAVLFILLSESIWSKSLVATANNIIPNRGESEEAQKTVTTGKDCDNKSTIQMYDGEINSPHFNGEKGHKTNCTWSLSPPDGTRAYYLKFIIFHLRLFSKDTQQNSACTGSYNLTLHGGKKIPCDQDIHHLNTAPHCTVYYSSDLCKDFVNAETCISQYNHSSNATVEKTSFPISITYVSDGRNDFEGFIWGFKSEYEFKECKQESQGSTSTATSAMSHVKNEAATAETQAGTTISVTAEVTTTTNAQGLGSSPIIGAVAGGIGLLMLIIVIVAILCIRKRKHNHAPESQPIGEEKVNPIYQSHDPNYTFAGSSTQSGAENLRCKPVNYETVDPAAANSQSDPTDSGHVTVNSQSADVVYCAATNKVVGQEDPVQCDKIMVDNVLYGTTQ